MARYPAPGAAGLEVFVGKGQCAACHFGPNFTNGEFDDVGVPYFAEKSRVDQGRHGGIAALRASPFNLLGAYNDDPTKATAEPTRHVEPQHPTGASPACPRCARRRDRALMHDGSLATLEAVVRHYSEVDMSGCMATTARAWCDRCGSPAGGIGSRELPQHALGPTFPVRMRPQR